MNNMELIYLADTVLLLLVLVRSVGTMECSLKMYMGIKIASSSFELQHPLNRNLSHLSHKLYK